MTEDLVPEPVERALWALVRAEISGAPLKQAAEEAGCDPRTLKAHRDRHHERYVQIREAEAPRMRSRIAAEQEDLTVLQTQVEIEAVRQLQERLTDEANPMETQELTLLVKHFSQAKANSANSAQRFRNEPTVVIEHRDTTEILQKLARLMPAAFDGQAELLETNASDEPTKEPSDA